MLDKTKFYINGRWVAPIDGTDLPVINPATEEAFATISLGGKQDAEAAIAAARHRASLGEISDAMERAFKRHKATTRVISGVYGDAYKDDAQYQLIQKKIAEYKDQRQRHPRILVAKMGQDGHDRGAKVIATAFADMGFDVDLSDMFETPREVAAKAIAADVDVIGVSSLAAGHRTLVPELIGELKKAGRDDIIVICGGVIPEQDYEFLQDAGVTAIFGPGSNVLDAANVVLAEVAGLRRNR